MVPNDFSIKKMIERQVIFPELRVWVTTKSFECRTNPEFGLCLWSNCLYIHFKKSDFPLFNYPVNGNYYQSSFREIEFHWGITFYECVRLKDGTEIVKIGCDYQHLSDSEDHGRCDSGERILREDMPLAVSSFLKIYKELESGLAQCNSR